MIKKTVTSLAAALSLFVPNVFGGTQFFQEPPPLEEPISLSSVSVKAFGFYQGGTTGEADFGGGLTLDYNLNPTFAVGITAAWSGDGTENSTGSDFLTALDFYFIPETTLPFKWYSVSSAGAVFGENVDYYLATGLGIEKEVFNNVSVYAEGRYVFMSDQDFPEARLGVKFSF